MGCDSILDAYINGALNEQEKKAFLIHAETCESCRRAIQTFHHYDSFVNSLFKNVKKSLKNETLGHLFCPGEDEFDLYLSKNMDKDAVKLFEYHLDGCSLCKEKLALLSLRDLKSGSLSDSIEVWRPLPVNLQNLITNQNQISQKLLSIINRLKQISFQGVAEIIRDLELLPKNISNNINQFSYAFEGDLSQFFDDNHGFLYLEDQNDEINALAFDADEYEFKVIPKKNELIINVMKNNVPVQNFEIRHKRKDGNEYSFLSNENGEIIISIDII